MSHHDVFISYSSKDKDIMALVVATLEEKGLRCWVAPRNVTLGKEWSEAIIEGIEQSNAFVLIFSANANESKQVFREVERAIAKGIPVLPFRIEDVAPSKALEYFISSQHWMDAYTPPIQQHANHLADMIRRMRGGPSRDGQAAAPCDKGDQPTTKAGSGRSQMAVAGLGTALLLACATGVGILALRPNNSFSGNTPPTQPQNTEPKKGEPSIPAKTPINTEAPDKGLAWADRQVPLETQVKVLKLETEKIDNAIKVNIDKLAKMEVEGSKLEQSVAALEQDQQKRRDEIAAMSKSLGSEDGPGKFTKSELRSKTNQLDLAVDTYKVKNEKLKSMRALLEAMKGTIEAAHQKIGDMKDQRDQLFVNIQKLETGKELVTIKNQQSQIVVSDDVLNRCNADVAKISDRLAELDKQVEIHQKFGFGDSNAVVPAEKETKSVKDVLDKAKAVLDVDDK